MTPAADFVRIASAIRGHARAEPRALLAFQEERLRRLVRHAYERVPYYRRLFDQHSLLPDAVRSIADLDRVPITSRAELQALPVHDRLARDLDLDRLIQRKTSGASGRPLLTATTMAEATILGLLRRRAYRQFGLRTMDRAVRIGVTEHASPDERPLLPRTLRRLGILRRTTVDLFAAPEQIIHWLRTLRPDVAGGYASAVARVAEAMSDDDRLALPTRFLISGAEALTPTLRERISTGFGAHVYDTYGSIEFNLLAWECPQTGELHTCDDGLILEIIGEDGHPAEPGETGEVVATNLHAYAMPFLRYRLGDIATRGRERCACGAPWGTLREIHGRTIDYFRLPGGRVIHPYQIVDDRVKPSAPWLRQHQIVQEREDRIVLHLVPRQPAPDEDVARIERAVRAFLGPSVEFEVRLAASLPLEPSGKFRPARSLVPLREGAAPRPSAATDSATRLTHA